MKYTMKQTLLCTVALVPTLAFAQADDSFALSPILVYGGLLPTTLAATGATIEVVDAEDLKKSGPGVADALARLPGVSLSANGGLGNRSTLRVRGLGSAYIGVRVDGIEVTDPSSTQSSFNFGTLTAGAVNRVTLIKGTQTAIYGSDAIAGVVDVETWRPVAEGASGRTTLEYGSFNTRTATSSVGFMDERVELAFTLSRVQTDGFSARSSDSENDGFKQNSANLYAAYQVNDALKVGVAGLWSDGTAEFDRSTTDSSGVSDETRAGLRAFAEYTQGAWLHEFSVSKFRTDRYDAQGFTKSFIGERLKTAYLGRVELSPATTLAFGLDWTKERASLDGTEYEASNKAVFAEAQFTLREDLELSTTLRYDDYTDFKGQFSGRAALAWHTSQATTVRASIGTGYRAPSLYERFGPYAGGNLAPETSTSLDLGVEHRIGEVATLRATAFYTEITDLIDFDFGTFAYAQVPGKTVTKGVELSGDYRVSDRITVSGNYTYTFGENANARLTRVPTHELIVGADFDVTDRFTTGLQVTHVAGVVDGFGTATPLDDYTVVDLTARYDITDRANAYVTVRNLTNEKYETVRGYNTSERAFYVGVQADF
tara:strand:- start:6864 stop:8663 length:1800 start_codon:yes stop_codon:yes gene_type:complete